MKTQIVITQERVLMVAMVGGKDKDKIRDRTPVAFRDLLISMIEGD